MGGAVFETLEGNTIEIGCDGDSITVNGIKMVNKKDIVTNNGVIHLIDQVLIPDSGEQQFHIVLPTIVYQLDALRVGRWKINVQYKECHMKHKHKINNELSTK